MNFMLVRTFYFEMLQHTVRSTRTMEDHSKPLFAKWIILRSTFFRQHKRRRNVRLETFWN